MARIQASELVERILEKSKEAGALLEGEFTLTSGEKSGYYFDGRLLTLSPEGANLVARAMLPMVRAAGAVAVGGPAVAAVPMVTEIVMLSGQDGGESVAGFFVRQLAREHGTGKIIEGPLAPSSRVAIVDDACSTGSSLYHAVKTAEEAGHTVVLVACILDRNQGGSERLRGDGSELFAVMAGAADGSVTAL